MRSKNGLKNLNSCLSMKSTKFIEIPRQHKPEQNDTYFFFLFAYLVFEPHIQTFLYKCTIRRTFLSEKENQDSYVMTSETGALRRSVMRMTITFKEEQCWPGCQISSQTFIFINKKRVSTCVWIKYYKITGTKK